MILKSLSVVLVITALCMFFVMGCEKKPMTLAYRPWVLAFTTDQDLTVKLYHSMDGCDQGADDLQRSTHATVWVHELLAI